nr:hypothetical protein [Variovorax sp. CY25R-8]
MLRQVAGDAVEPFDDQDVEPIGQRVGQQCLSASAQSHRRRAADAFVGVDHRDRPALASSALAARA